MTFGAHTAAYRFVAAGLLSIGIAVAAYGTLQVTLDPKPASIKVKWAPSVDDTIRRALEERYRLSMGELMEGRTWKYALRDTSRTNISALVSDQVIEDTGDIDRTAFRVSRASTRGPYPPALHPRMPASLRAATVVFFFIGLIGISLGLVERAAPGTIATWFAPQKRSLVSLRPRQRHAVLLLLGTLLALDVASMRHMTITYDEPLHFRYGQSILNLDSTRDVDAVMPLSALNALPSALASRLPSGRLSSFLGSFQTGRYLTVCFSLLVALCVFAWTRELYSVNAGLLALTLYVFDPNLLAHSQLVTTDLYVAGAITFALYFFWRFLHQGGLARALVSGLMLGLAQLAKYTAIPLFPLFGVIALGFYARHVFGEIRERRFNALRRRGVVFSAIALAFLLTSLLVINIGFLFNQTLTPLDQYSFHSNLFRSIQSSAGVLGRLPLPVPYPYIEGLDLGVEHERTGSNHGRIYLLGELRQGEGFAGYYVVAGLYKFPIATLLVLLATGVAFLVRRRRFDFLRNEAVLLWPIVFFAIYFNFFYRAQIGIRHALVMVPLLYVLSGSLLAKGVALTRPVAIALATTVAGLILSVMSYYPHFLPYFNELIWDRTRAYTVLADSNLDWGQNGRYLAQYQATHPGLIDEPDTPTTGTILVRVNALTGVVGDPEKFRWLREHFTPVDHVAHGSLVYRISETDLERIGRAPEKR